MTTPLLDSNGMLNGESVRYVAIGDSFTEGVGDVDRRRPNSLRGWADRVAEGLGAVDPQAQYANLAIRGRLLIPILEEQLPAALDLKPNLVTFDRLHMNDLGHERFASRVLAQLGLPGVVTESVLPPEVQLTVREKIEQEARWVREFALPWIGRRLKGTSSGDGVSPKYPEWVPAASLKN